ncbi:hypothetical protein [Microbacterium sp. AR7-10]|uniref:hypothetical protein n=1 Tax=Microbacterium sp. AR7-10 TaxID=1891970 RepID=UPI0008FC9747|nr:hypothetical protein [Microbacterium sp. AR7-10]OIU88636.1 hypothetical protein BFN01_04125 [Microbacterium sp. AR7-10]
MSMPAPIPHPAMAATQAPAAEASLPELVARRVALKADAEYIKDEIEAVDAKILAQLEVGTHDVAGTKVQVREYSRLSLPAVERDYPAEQYPDLYVTKTSIDKGAVEKSFVPNALEQYKVRGAKSVVV